jgi:hypothetical protein
MPRRHVVRDLDDDQFSFVINCIINGLTDREISSAFEKTFEQKLAKSSLHRWREAAGNELAERYRLARYQSRQLLENLQREDGDQYDVIMKNIEDRLLTATREVIAQDPIKLLQLRLDEEKRRLKLREFDLKEKQINLEMAKLGTNKIDPEKLPAEIIENLFNFIGSNADGLRWFRANAKKFEAFLKQSLEEKYAQA